MNKLFKFAGVSALALVTAAPNAFGAFGRFDPYCIEQNMKEVKLLTLGHDSRGRAQYNDETPLTIYYDVNTNRWCNDAECSQEYTKPYQLLEDLVIDDATDMAVTEKVDGGVIEIGQGDLTTSLIPYGAMYLGSAQKALAYVFPNTTERHILPFQSLTTGSTCSFSSGEYASANMIAPGQSTGVWAYDTNATTALPTLVGEDSQLPAAEQAAIIATSTIYYVVRYAADCVSEEVQEEKHATCSLNVNATGRVNYTNTCMTGSKADKDMNGFASPTDANFCVEIETPETPPAMTGNQSNELPDTNIIKG